MIDKIQDPILITGVGRSGSSMIAGVINLCGAYGGNMGGSNKNYENIQIYKQAMIPYFQSVGADPLGQYPLPGIGSLPIPTDWADRIATLIREDGYVGGPWMFKGSRISLIWPVFHYAFPNAKWLIVRRRTGDILHSCNKTTYMKAFRDIMVQQSVGAKDETEGWLWWVHQHLNIFREMMDEGLNIKVIWPERMVHCDYQQMYEVVEWLGLRWNSDALKFADGKFSKLRNGLGKINV